MTGKGYIDRSCKGCGGAFKAKATDVRRGHAIFCSRECRFRSSDRDFSKRFWSRVDLNGPEPGHVHGLGNCWVWTALKNRNGYGRIILRSDGKKHYALAHRVAFFLSDGRWPELLLCHRCDNPSCVRRDHLFEGTQRDNMLDMVSKGRRRLGRPGVASEVEQRQ